MATKTEIANLGMYKLGQTAFDDVDTSSEPNATKVNAIWEIVTDDILTRWNWKCAKKRVAELEVDSTEPAFGYDYRYALPDGEGDDPYCLKVLSVSVDGTELTDCEVEGRYVLTNQEDEEIDLLYVKRITTYSEYTPSLAVAIASKLAMELALGITQSTKIADRAERDFNNAILRAKQTNEMEEYKEKSSSSWLNAR